MWIVENVDQAIQISRKYGARDPLHQFIVSVVFAPPGAAIWSELTSSVGHLDSASGDWALCFAGAPVKHSGEPRRASEAFALAEDHREYPGLHPTGTRAMIDSIQREHEQALVENGFDASKRWTYRGGVEIVSVMGYGRNVDWLSLNSVDVDALGSLPLSRAAESMRDWKSPSWAAPAYAPGLELPSRAEGRTLLAAGLALVAAEAGTDIARELIENFLAAMSR